MELGVVWRTWKAGGGVVGRGGKVDFVLVGCEDAGAVTGVEWQPRRIEAAMNVSAKGATI
jgi:hypothetical protein